MPDQRVSAGSACTAAMGVARRVSVTSGTIFDKTRVPLTTWFEAIWLFTSSKAGVSAATLHRVLPISSYQTLDDARQAAGRALHDRS